MGVTPLTPPTGRSNGRKQNLLGVRSLGGEGGAQKGSGNASRTPHAELKHLFITTWILNELSSRRCSKCFRNGSSNGLVMALVIAFSNDFSNGLLMVLEMT